MLEAKGWVSRLSNVSWVCWEGFDFGCLRQEVGFKEAFQWVISPKSLLLCSAPVEQSRRGQTRETDTRTATWRISNGMFVAEERRFWDNTHARRGFEDGRIDTVLMASARSL